MFSHDNCQLMYYILPKEKHYLVDRMDLKIDDLIEEIVKGE